MRKVKFYLKSFFSSLTLYLLSIFVVGGAWAACGIDSGRINVLANDFPAVRAVVDEAALCGGGGVSFSKHHNKDHKDLTVAALTPNPAEYTSVIISNSSITPLLNAGLLRPLDGYLRINGGEVSNFQRIIVDGKVMAIAFMSNAQHLFYRRDILAKAGVSKVPLSYEEVLDAASLIKSKGLMRYPLAGTYKAGWNLGEEFVNMYFGFGGEFFAPGSANPSIANSKGVATLEMMKKLSQYMNPDYLTHDSNSVQSEWKAGNVAITNLWGSRAKALLDPEDAVAGVADNTFLERAPTVGGGNIPASTLWWDGFAIAKNISDRDASATYKSMVHGASAKMANNNPGLAVWLIPGFSSVDKSTIGVRSTVQGGAKPYPMVPYMGLLHSAIGSEIVDFMRGDESAEDALRDVEASYVAKAKEAGFL